MKSAQDEIGESADQSLHVYAETEGWTRRNMMKDYKLDGEKDKQEHYGRNFNLARRELLAQIIKRKMALSGHAFRNNKCNLVKTCILGMMLGKRRRRGAPGCNTSMTSRSGQGHPWKKTYQKSGILYLEYNKCI